MEFGARMKEAKAVAKANRLENGIVLIKKKRKTRKAVTPMGVTVNNIEPPGETATKFELTRLRDFRLAYEKNQPSCDRA